jgi:hypothetical protein
MNFGEALAVFIVAGSDESQYRASIPKKQHLFLKDQNGNIPWFKKVLYAPYLLIYWVFWKFFRKNKIPVEILPGLYISSRPDAEDLKNFGNIDSLKVYDLSAEMEEISMIKEQLNYHSVSFLDIGSFETDTTKKLVADITENYKILLKTEKS